MQLFCIAVIQESSKDETGNRDKKSNKSKAGVIR